MKTLHSYFSDNNFLAKSALLLSLLFIFHVSREWKSEISYTLDMDEAYITQIEVFFLKIFHRNLSFVFFCVFFFFFFFLNSSSGFVSQVESFVTLLRQRIIRFTLVLHLLDILTNGCSLSLKNKRL